MSVESISAVLHHSRAVGTDKVVLIGIANHDGDGGSWPALATLARYANVDERSARRAVRRLEGLGEIAVHMQAGGRRDTRPDRRPNRYEIRVQCPPGCQGGYAHTVPVDNPSDGGTPTSPRDVNGGTPASGTGGHRRPARGDTGVPRTVLEPSKEEAPPTPHAPSGAQGAPRSWSCKRHRARPKRWCRECQASPPQPPPPWCGQCQDDHHRFVEVSSDTVAKCPRCHPDRPPAEFATYADRSVPTHDDD